MSSEAETGEPGRAMEPVGRAGAGAGGGDGQLALGGKAMVRPGERARWNHVEAVRDRAVVSWVGRFRFVTIEVLAERFGVSKERMRARIRRLEQLGYVLRAPRLPSQAAVIYLTPAGARLIGGRRHRKPRYDTHRVHELAIAQLVCDLELAGRPDIEVLTERDARDRQATSQRRYCVDVHDGRGGVAARWPDVFLVSSEKTIAVEVEFAEKGSDRLRGILDAYLASSMTQVRFLVSSPALAGRISRLAAEQSRGMRAFSPTVCTITVAPWRDVTPDIADKIRARIV